MGANAGELSIAVGADFTKFQADFAKGTAQAEQSAARTERAMNHSLTGGVRDFSRVISTAVKGMIALEAVAATVKFSTAAMKGDFEGMEKVVDSLPFGIGRVAEALRPVAEYLIGVKSEDYLTADDAERQRAQLAGRRLANIQHPDVMSELEFKRKAAEATTQADKIEAEYQANLARMRVQVEAAREANRRSGALSPQQLENQLQAQFKLIDAQYEAAKREAAKKDVAKKSTPSGRDFIESGQTAIGAFSVAAAVRDGPEKAIQRETAKNTRRTADAVEKMAASSQEKGFM